VNRWRRAYLFVAVQLLNTLLVFVVLNLVIATGPLVVVWFRASPSVPPRLVDPNVDRAAYNAIPPEHVQRLLEEQTGMQLTGFQYEPWVLFRNPEYHGRFLNTDARGLRRTRAPRTSCSRPIRIYVFGGSTTFGYGVSDEYTLPSSLQMHLERRHPSRCVEVTNYGQGYFFSSQEMLQLITLLKDGHAPDWAIFVDGANDTYQLSSRRDVPYFSDTVRSLWVARHRGSACPRFDWSWLPAAQLATAIRDRIWGPPPPTPVVDAPVPVPDSERSGTYVAERYTHNVRMIRALCAEYGVKCRFVWQPTFFDYDRTLHPGFPYPGEVPKFWAEAYEGVRRSNTSDVLYLGDMLRTVREKVFVDNVHYNEKWTGEIAARIVDVIDLEPSRPRLSR
jgi:lysophospholipase L1-like esterase